MYLIFLPQIFSQLCFCLKDMIKIVRPLLAAMSINGLTQSYLWISLTSVVWTYGTFENALELSIYGKRYLKGSCWSFSDQHFSFKKILKNVLLERYHQKGQVALATTCKSGFLSRRVRNPKDFIKILCLLLPAVSINGLMITYIQAVY